jgi:hypothetical protein
MSCFESPAVAEIEEASASMNAFPAQVRRRIDGEAI